MMREKEKDVKVVCAFDAGKADPLSVEWLAHIVLLSHLRDIALAFQHDVAGAVPVIDGFAVF